MADPVAIMVENLMRSYIAVAGVAFGIAIALASLVYMIGSALMNEKIKLWAKMELYEIIFSAIIVVLVFMLVPVASDITNAALDIGGSGSSATSTFIKIPTPSGYNEEWVDLCGNRDIFGYENVNACHLRLAIYYFRTLYEEGRLFGYNILRTYAWTSFFAETAITVQLITEKMGMVMWVPQKGLFTMRNQAMEFCFGWIVSLMVLNKFQELFVKFFAIAVFPVLVVLGGLLRTFTFTRRLGGLLLGLAIACYFIYPAIYALGGLLLIGIKNEARPMWIANTDANPDGSMDPPIINTLYIKKADSNIVAGQTKIMDDYSDVEKQMAQLDWQSEYARQDREKKLREDATPGWDMGERVPDSEKEGLLGGIANLVKEIISYLTSGNFLLNTEAWHDGGYIEITARFAYFSILFSLFAIFGTIASIRSLAMTLGGDIELAGLTRLI